MSLHNIIVPQMGESIHEVTLIKTYKKNGDIVKNGDLLADLATDKVDTELLANADGVIENIFFTKDKTVIPIGAIFASVQTNSLGNSTAAPTMQYSPAPVIQAEKVNKVQQESIEISIQAPINVQENALQKDEHIAFDNVANLLIQTPTLKPININMSYLSPIVSQLIFENKISQNELNYIQGTGEQNRISKRDVLDYIQSHRATVLHNIQQTGQTQKVLEPIAPKTNQAFASSPFVNNTTNNNIDVYEELSPNAYIGKTEIKYNLKEGETLKPLDRMRLTISKNLKQSKEQNVQVTSFAEIDVTNMVAWREKNKGFFETQTRQKLTYTPLIIEALIKTLQEFPTLNNVLKGDSIIERNNINIGIATALSDGNLIVPVIKKTQEMDLVHLTTSLNDLVKKARANELMFADIDGGTFTLTNIGTFNSLMGTPILPPNQSGILATGMIQKKPIIQNTIFGEAIVVRHMMFVSLSYDHRIIDGIVGGGFLNYFAKLIEAFNPNRMLLF